MSRRLLLERLPASLSLMGISLVLSMTVGIAVGAVAAVKQYSLVDYATTTFAVLGNAREPAAFDVLASKVTARVAEHMFRECIADVGDDEVIVRGVDDSDLHGGVAHLR